MHVISTHPLLSPLYGKEGYGIIGDQHSKRIQDTLSKVLEEMKELYIIAIPMIMAGLLVYGKSLISMFFMGMIGKDALTGGSLAICVANITGYSVVSGLAAGMEGISSQAYGANKWSLMGQTLNRTILIILTLATFPISFSWFNSKPLFLYWFNNNQTLSTIATTYLKYSIPSLILQSFINPLRIHLRTQKLTKPLMLSAALALASHAPINYYFINHLGFNNIGAVALSASLTDFNIFVSLAFYLYFFGAVTWSWPEWSFRNCFLEWKPILSQAIPSCISVCLEWWWYELMIMLSGLLVNSGDAVACMGILMQATMLVYQFPFALNQAASTRVGIELGANQPKKAKTAAFVALSCGFVTGIVSLVFMVAVKDTWGKIFTKDRAILSLSAAVLPVVGLCEVGNCPQTTVCGVLRGSGRASMGACINVGSFYGVGFPVAMFVGFKMGKGLIGLWVGLVGAQLVCAFVMVVVLVTTDWNVQAERAKELTRSTSNDVDDGLVSLVLEN
ncbi:protein DETOXIFICATION 49-like [Cannabis sativa]|uniref:protein DETOXIFICATION 49-like n=1 Tax=Cannabis sativa TaxID=3483 RepID=UPI0029C9CEA8|nr:protein DETOXIFICATION 49-like [Cannabis sativa]